MVVLANLYGVLNHHLSDGRDHICSDCSIADMACYPWIFPHEKQRQDLNQFPALRAWFERIQNRPATQRADAIAKSVNTTPTVDEKAKAILFGQDAKTVV
jgi:GSH-dependent disulfide-bond oxidoreductase